MARMPTPDNCAARATLAAFLLALALPVLAADVALEGPLAGGNVVSSTDSPATGEVRARLDDDGRLMLQMGYAGLGEPATAASLHVGPASENGRRVADLPLPSGGTEGRIDTTVELSEDDAARAREGEAYIQVSTLGHPDGAIRAQLMPKPVQLEDLPAPPEG
ncbi:CHRD domain-containing protein [Lysobacter sp. A3-1-A15]|uniref:CHRD domain-containing protein n=1 Tax=Novilysobacter viscosus TaxID=3098602 RepID=UPI002ED87FB5